MTSRKGFSGRNRRRWVAGGAVLIAAVAAALLPSPAAIAGTASATWLFAALASAAIVTLVILPFMVWPAAARPSVWVATVIGSLAIGLLSFVISGYAERTCTAQYGETPVVIGTDLTPLGATYRQANPDLSTDDLLFDAAGVPERIWTRSSIGRCTVLLGGTYFLWVPLLAVCLIATVQAVPTSILAPVRWNAPPPKAPPAPALQYDIFMSYRHGGEDSRFTRDLVAALEEEGYRVAIDERDFVANASFLQEMERCIHQSRFTVAVISPRYLESGNTEEEAIITKVLDMQDRKRRLIPIVIEPVILPVWLFGLVGIDWTKRDPLVEPLDKLKAALGAPLSM